MEELNKKLAEWAGFTKADIRKRYYFKVGGERVPKWYPPDSEYSIHLPAFTDSLDACFKWLVPKLKPEAIKLVPVNDGITTYAEKWGCVIIPEGWGFHTSVIADSPNPALALCKAIEKLIDEEGK